LKIAIIGTVGVPARYGGFETLAEQLVRGIARETHTLVVYCQRSAYPDLRNERLFSRHERVLLPLKANGPLSMVHDMLAMTHAAIIARADVMLVLGYSGAWFFPFIRIIFPKKRIITNMDGMEWRRRKFGCGARALLRSLEWLAVRFSHQLVADNAGIVDLVKKFYGVSPRQIAYGGDHTLVEPSEGAAIESGYYLSIARIEPENNCHMILEACELAGVRLVFIGNWLSSEYGRGLKTKYAASRRLILLEPIYDLAQLVAVRFSSIGYIHGHSVGGTNPSLVEALFHTSNILAFDCVFNRSTLVDAGGYFSGVSELTAMLKSKEPGRIVDSCLAELRNRYRWKSVVGSYVDIFEKHALCAEKE
jgi:glycosyltransferase involved in cell wall biosynthesis